MEAHINTNRGTIKLNLFYDLAPLTVSNFVNLANRGYYDNLKLIFLLTKSTLGKIP